MKQTSKRKKNQESSHYGWAMMAFVLAVVLSAVLSLVSESILKGTGLLIALLILFLFIALGIFFDIIGVAVTAADQRPFHSMASHKEKGAKESLMLLRNAERVSSVCNDVVGDICGIVSGTTAAVIISQLQGVLNSRTVMISVGITALISGMTIGGKALGKAIALKESTKVVYMAGRFLHFFHRKR